MREGWEEMKMVEACEILTCGVASTPKYVDESIGVPFLSAQNVREGEVVLDKFRYISKEFHEHLTKKNKPHKGDILYSRVGAKYGEAGVVEHDFEFSVYVSLTLMRPKNELFNNYFFKYYLNSPRIKDLAKKSISSSGVPNLNVKSVREFPVPTPPLQQQQQIVALLDKAFKAIDQAKANIEKNIANAKELFQSKLNDIFSQKGKGWEEKSLGEVCDKTKNIKWQEHTNETFEYIDLSSVCRESLSVTETTTVDEKNAPSRARKLINFGDVIFATTRPTLKRATIIDKEFSGQICSTGYVVLRPNKNISSEWIFYYLLTSNFMDRMESLQRGASYPAVSDNDVKGSVLSIPLNKEDEKRNVILMKGLREGTNDLISSYQQKLGSLEELKKSILQKAFAGELTNKGVEILID